VLLAALVVTMLASGVLGVAIERIALRPLRNVKGPAAMITTIGVSTCCSTSCCWRGGEGKNFPTPLPPTASSSATW